MPPDQPDSQCGTSKRHRRCRSHSTTNQVTVVDLTDESGSSRKHGLHEKDPQVEGPSKRPKMKRDSEPPMRKDTTLAPKAKRKKSREKVNHHKASRTSNHHQLKDRVKLLESVRDSVIEAHDDETKELQADLDWHRTELKRFTQLHEEQIGKVREQKQMVEIERQENQALKRKLEDAVNCFEASKLSCQNKDAGLKEKEKVITVQRQELDESKHRSKSLEEFLAETEITVKTKDEVIKALKKELDDGKRQITSLEQCLTETKLALEEKNNTIHAMQKELDSSKHQCASLKESLVETKDSLFETQVALKAAKRIQSDWREQLVSNEDELRSTKRELDETKKDLEKTTRKADALHLINDENGSWNHKITQREETAKDKLKSERAENKKNAQKLDQEKSELRGRCEGLEADLEARENERNQAVGSLQSKLNASRQRYSYKEPDEKVKTDFTSLESRIRQFVNKYARPVLNATDQELKTLWPNWSPGLRSFLACPLLCNQILEAYVWECLISRIFTPGSEVWAGELGESLEKTLRMAAGEIDQAGYESDDYIDFQYLRSSSSSLISRLNGKVFLPKYFDSDAETMFSTVGRLCGLNEANAGMKADAMGIFEEARDFEIQLRLLKAVYTFQMYKLIPEGGRLKYGFLLADNEMDDRSPNRSGKSRGKPPMVDFIMCPGLYKRGNNSGANYDSETCLVKMGVVCDTKELFQKLESSTSTQLVSTPAPKALHSGKAKQENGGSTSRNNPTSTANKATKGSSLTNPLHIKGEETDSQHDPLFTAGLTSGSPAPKMSDSGQMQSGRPRTMNNRGRGRAQPKTNSSVRDGKSSAKQAKKKPYPMGPASGRGGGSSGRKTRNSKESDPDADYNSKSTV